MTAQPELTDSHAHLDMPRFSADLSEVMARAREAGVTRIVTVGIDALSSRKAVDLAQEHSGVFAAVGIHPEEARNSIPDDIDYLAELAKHPGVVAVGEIGLDFYRDYGPKERQVEVFKRQLELAARLQMPVIIHSRQAEAELVPILKEWLNGHAAEAPGVIHCFNGSLVTAKEYLRMGFYISLGGYIGYPSARAIREVVKELPIDRLLLETDSPFLPPQSHRGERNEPSYVAETARELAGVKGLSYEEIAGATTENVKRVLRTIQ